MKDLIRSNDIVLISFARSVLEGAGLVPFVFDEHMSITEGSIGLFPRRLAIIDDDYEEAVELLKGADLGNSIWVPDTWS